MGKKPKIAIGVEPQAHKLTMQKTSSAISNWEKKNFQVTAANADSHQYIRVAYAPANQSLLIFETDKNGKRRFVIIGQSEYNKVRDDVHNAFVFPNKSALYKSLKRAIKAATAQLGEQYDALVKQRAQMGDAAG